MDESRPDQQIGYILRSYPRLSQTFILNEILGLENLGFILRIFALSPSGEELVQPATARVRARVSYLDAPHSRSEGVRAHAGLLSRRPGLYLSSLLYLAGRPYLNKGYSNTTRGRVFSQAVKMVNQIHRESLPGIRRITRLHAHFAHDPALVGLIASLLAGLPFSFTTHARDLYQLDRRALLERIRQADAVITCCQANLDYLRQMALARDLPKFHLVHHGVDLDLFHSLPDVRHPAARPRLVSAGRLVEKKGFSDLLTALQMVKDQGQSFDCRIYGDGPLRPSLETQIRRMDLSDHVQLMGACSQEHLALALRQASLFILTPTVTADGDRDGLPNVLVEAMASGLPVISTCVGGIPDLVVPGRNGILASPGDAPEIAAAVWRLLADPSLRQKLGTNALQDAASSFDQRAAAGRLAALFSPGTA